MALVLGILLYGSEVWSLREDLYHRLRRFHNRCARTMCRITIVHTIRHRITTNSLFAKLEIDPLDTYTAPTATHPLQRPRAQRHSEVAAAFVGDRAFARARAAGKNATKAGRARAKAEADIALSLPAAYRD